MLHSTSSLLTDFPAANANQDDIRSTTTSRANSAQLMSIFASTRPSDQGADSLTRRMSNLDVTMSDNVINPLRRSVTQEKEAGLLLTTLLREELVNEDVQSRSFQHRQLHTKCKAKRFKRESRKGIQRMNGFANFYF
jgi:hypothetical protein